MSFWYLATPYTKYAAGLEEAFADASREAAMLLRAGVQIYSPIAHMHPMAVYGGLDPRDHDIWLPANRTFMEAARGLIVCMLPGWMNSYGVQEEIGYFERRAAPLIYMTPGLVPAELAP